MAFPHKNGRKKFIEKFVQKSRKKGFTFFGSYAKIKWFIKWVHGRLHVHMDVFHAPTGYVF